MTAHIGLHGFTQSGRMFDELSHYLARPLLASDLPGHGRAGNLPATTQAVMAIIDEAAMGLPPVLVGYSMGARLALQYAVDRPTEALVLISGSPGIVDPGERERRREADARLAEVLIEKGLEGFIDDWLAAPMFAGLHDRDPLWQAVDRQHRLANSPADVARALIGLGQGTQPYVGNRLAEIEAPTLIVAGMADEKYVAIAEDMARRISGARLEILVGHGHALVGEAPAQLGDLINRFLHD